MPQAAQCLDVLLVDIGSIGKSRHGAFDARFAQQMQRGIRRAVGVVLDILRSGIAELVVRVKARDLKFRRESQFGHGSLGRAQKLAVLDKFRQHIRMNQQRGLAFVRARRVQNAQFAREVFQQRRPGVRATHAIADTIVHMHGLGEGAQVETDDRCFEPGARRGDDFISSDLDGRYLQCVLPYRQSALMPHGCPLDLKVGFDFVYR